MPEVDTFGATKADIERLVEHRINSLVEGELSIGTISEVLGSLKAIEAVTARIADTERRAARAEAARDALRARLAAAGAEEGGRLREAMDDLESSIDQLQKTRFELSAHLEKLARTLRP